MRYPREHHTLPNTIYFAFEVDPYDQYSRLPNFIAVEVGEGWEGALRLVEFITRQFDEEAEVTYWDDWTEEDFDYYNNRYEIELA